MGLSLVGVVIYLGGVKSLLQFKHLKPFPLLGALFAVFGSTAIITVRWGIIVNTIGGCRVTTWFDYYHCFITNRALGLILPKDLTDLGGRTFWLMQFHKLPLSQASTSIILDRLLDILSLSILLIAVLPYWLGWTSAPVGIGMMSGFVTVFGGLLFVGHDLWVNRADWLLDKGLKFVHRLPWIRRKVPQAFRSAVLNRGIILQVYLFSVIKFICTVGQLYFFSLTLNLPVSPVFFLLGAPIGQLSYLFAFTPGGLGIFEVGWFAVLTLGGVEPGYATVFVVGQRVLTTGLIGLLASLTYILHILHYYFPFSIGNDRHAQNEVTKK